MASYRLDVLHNSGVYFSVAKFMVYLGLPIPSKRDYCSWVVNQFQVLYSYRHYFGCIRGGGGGEVFHVHNNNNIMIYRSLL